jgi:hypothetical protein
MADGNNTGRATYTFQAIGDYGAAFFDVMQHEVCLLSNMVGIYKVETNKEGDNTLWKWGN